MKHVILLPTYNESENIEHIISRIFALHPEIYIKVIDDNSPDGTAGIVSRLMQKFKNLSLVSRPGKQGLGKAYMHGFSEVVNDPEATHVIMMDADMSHDPKYIQEMVKESKNFDLVIGSRYVAGGGTIGWETHRKVLSRAANIYAQAVTGLPIQDTTAGFNCISLLALRAIDLNRINSGDYVFQVELKYLLHRQGASIKEIPIIFSDRRAGASKMSGNNITRGALDLLKTVMYHQ